MCCFVISLKVLLQLILLRGSWSPWPPLATSLVLCTFIILWHAVQRLDFGWESCVVFINWETCLFFHSQFVLQKWILNSQIVKCVIDFDMLTHLYYHKSIIYMKTMTFFIWTNLYRTFFVLLDSWMSCVTIYHTFPGQRRVPELVWNIRFHVIIHVIQIPPLTAVTWI